jgi:hypothetical protein
MAAGLLIIDVVGWSAEVVAAGGGGYHKVKRYGVVTAALICPTNGGMKRKALRKEEKREVFAVRMR